MVGADVGHHAHVVGGVADPAQQDPATGRLEHGQVAAPARPARARRRRSRSSPPPRPARRGRRCRPSWSSPPSGRAPVAMWAISRVVVLLPFVPVTATIGIRGLGRCGSGPWAVARRPASSRAPVERPRASRAAAARRWPGRWSAGATRRRRATRRPSTEPPRRDARLGQVQRRRGGAGWPARRRSATSAACARLFGGELELHGRTREEPVRAVEHAQLDQLDTASGWSARRGMAREYIDRHARPERAAAHRRGAPAALPGRARIAGEHRLRLVHARRRQPGRRPRRRCARRARRHGRARSPTARPTAGRSSATSWSAGIDGDGPRLLLIGHMDTVFDAGTAAARPYRSDGDRATGPGVTDMKAGLLAGLHAIAALQRDRRATRHHLRRQPGRGDRLAVQHARPSARLAPEHDVGAGARVRARQRRHRQRAQGHRRLSPRARRSSGARRGRTGEGPVRHPGGGAPGARPPRAQRPLADRDRQRGRHPRRHATERGRRAMRDPRRPAGGHGRRVRRRSRRGRAAGCLADRRGRHRRCRVAAPGIRRWRRPTPPRAWLPLAAAIAAELGFELPDAATGGAIRREHHQRAGVPTLDGLGPIGGDDHSVDEWLDLTSVVPRTALLAGLIGRIGEALSAPGH